MMKRIVTILAAAALAALAAPEAAAQGCAMCAESVAAAGEQGRRAIGAGILILLAPTLVLFCGVFFLAFRRNHSR